MPASAEAATRPHAHDLSAHLQPRPLPAELLQQIERATGYRIESYTLSLCGRRQD